VQDDPTIENQSSDLPEYLDAGGVIQLQIDARQ
jgi:hypothetical protein